MMITDLLLRILNVFIGLVVGLLPDWDWTLPAIVTEAVSRVKAWDAVFPITETFTCLTVAVTFVAAMVGWKWTIKVVDWIADIIP